MGTNEVLKMCRKCRTFTAIAIDALDRLEAREIICQKCKSASVVPPTALDPGIRYLLPPNPDPPLNYGRRRREYLLGVPAIEIA